PSEHAGLGREGPRGAEDPLSRLLLGLAAISSEGMGMRRVWAGGGRACILLTAACLLLASCTGGGKGAVSPTGRVTSQPVPSLPSPSPLNPSILAADPTVQVVKRVAPAVVN